jgi:uroporphyrinogen decarboxylase
MVRAAVDYDLDFVKYMPYGLFSTVDWGVDLAVFSDDTTPPVNRSFAVTVPEDWDKITARSGVAGEYAVVLESQRLFFEVRAEALGAKAGKALSKSAAKTVAPVIQTVFSPATTAAKLAGADTLVAHLRSHPAKVHRALDVITATTIEFARAAVAAGADGIFFATQMSTTVITAAEHAAFVAAYDVPVLDAVKGDTWFNVLHVHGANIRFVDVLDYPVHALNWHDRDDGPSLADAADFLSAANRTRAFVGGLGHTTPLHAGTDAEVAAQIDDTWDAGRAVGTILAPGCAAHPCTSAARLAFIRDRVAATAI